MNSVQKFSGVFFILMMLIVISYACKKDEETKTPPSISIMAASGFIRQDTILSAGDEIRLKVLLQKGDHEITNFRIDVATEDGSQNYFDTAMNTPYIVWEGSFIKSFALLEEWELTVRDREGKASSTSLIIGLDTASGFQPLILIPSITLGAQNNNMIKGCYNTTAGSMHYVDEASADTLIQAGIDLIYYFSAEDKNTLASPGANIEDGIFAVNPSEWSIVNTTRYFKTNLTGDDFIGATNDSIILANYNEAEAKRKAKGLKPDDIYTFRTQQGRLGMFIVNLIDEEAEGKASFHLKIQQ